MTHSLTDSFTDSCLVNLIDVTLACEDGNSKLVEVVTVVEVDDEKRVDNSLVQIWKINFGHKVCSDFEDKVSRFVQDLKLRFRRDFEVVSDWGTMIACHMKAKYIYTYVGLTTMI